MTKQYLIKREYLGFKNMPYWLKYGGKTVLVMMEWISGEYRIVSATTSPNKAGLDDFPYKKTVGVIDRIEELLKE